MFDPRGELRNSAGALADHGIDVRGAGFGVMPPSPHPEGGQYYWIRKLGKPDSVPECPSFIYDAIAAQPERKSSPSSERPRTNGAAPTSTAAASDRARKHAWDMLRFHRDELAATPPSARHKRLNVAAYALGRLAHVGAFSEDEARAALTAACTTNGMIGEGRTDEVKGTITDAWAAGLANPRDIEAEWAEHRTANGQDPRREDPTTPQSEDEYGTEGETSALHEKAPDSEGLGAIDIAADKSPIPPRPWLLGVIFCLGYFSSIIGEGGVGKTAVRMLQWLSVATGRNLIGDHVFKRMRVLLVCLEDDYQEIRRRLKAAQMHYGIPDEEIEGWLFVSCPRGVKLAELKDGSPAAGKLEKMVRAEIALIKPGLVSFDPYVKTHALAENDNSAMDFVVGLLTNLAAEFNVAVDGPHHTRKGANGTAGDPDSGRGASAMKDAARLVYTLMRMTPEEAGPFGIKADAERHLLVRFDSGKVNLCPPAAAARWFKLVGVELGNGTDEYPHGDNVQTVEPWTPPDKPGPD